jgi:hypothetical protein
MCRQRMFFLVIWREEMTDDFVAFREKMAEHPPRTPAAAAGTPRTPATAAT